MEVLLLCLPLARLHKVSREGISGEVDGKFRQSVRILLMHRPMHSTGWSFSTIQAFQFYFIPHDLLHDFLYDVHTEITTLPGFPTCVCLEFREDDGVLPRNF
jgi:hypothetical protein